MIKWFRYVPMPKVPDFVKSGNWRVANTMQGTHHGCYSVLMEWIGEGEPE